MENNQQNAANIFILFQMHVCDNDQQINFRWPDSP